MPTNLYADISPSTRSSRNRTVVSAINSIPIGSVYRVDRDPIWLEGHGRDLERAPMMGEHSEYVVCSILGRSREQFDGLVAGGVVY